MFRKWIRKFFLILSLFLGILLFQNCSKSGFNATETVLLSNDGQGNPTPTPYATSDDLSFILQPSSQKVIVGQVVTFRARGASLSNLPLTYQWYKNNFAIAGATSTSYQTPILTKAEDDFRYHVLISNANRTLNSNQATLTVQTEDEIVPVADLIIAPSTVDPAMSDEFGDFIVQFNENVSRKSKLFIFFPASGSNPAMDLLIIKNAALNGFHAIGFPYANRDVVALLCASDPDVSCQAKIREETLTGADASPKVIVSVADSVNNRMLSILKYLAQSFPAQGWSNFFLGDQVIWDDLRLSGHSQGGGLAAFAAIKNSVDRVCTFSSPADFDNDLNIPANWVVDNGLTSPSRYYGLGSTKDNIVPWVNLQKIWNKLGMGAFGVPVNIDGVGVGYNGSHMLNTSQGTAGNGHGIPVVDSVTPKNTNGKPLFVGTWQYLCFH